LNNEESIKDYKGLLKYKGGIYYFIYCKWSYIGSANYCYLRLN